MIEAVHEAGHAVVARLLAQPVKRTALAVRAAEVDMAKEGRAITQKSPARRGRG
jgi:hypothetical protein